MNRFLGFSNPQVKAAVVDTTEHGHGEQPGENEIVLTGKGEGENQSTAEGDGGDDTPVHEGKNAAESLGVGSAIVDTYFHLRSGMLRLAKCWGLA